MKKKNGFTLIELLAVIIILGILMILAVPAVTKYINDSKKETYVNNAKNIINGTRTLANSETLKMNDKNATYYIPASYIKTDNDMRSPYGKLTEAYIGVTVNDYGYEYYWASRDDTGTGIKNITPAEKLDPNNIEDDIGENEITNKIRTTGIGNRSIIKVLNESTGAWDTIELSDISNNIGEDGKLPTNILCKKATTLHTKICTLQYSYFACGSAFGPGNEITYGTLLNGILKPGDAFDCDVNNDGVYDSTTERFYYMLSDGNNSTLIYYKNINDSSMYQYDSTHENWHGPRTAYQYLPSINEWSNPKLVLPGTRQITNENGGNTTAGTTIESFSYTGKAARLLTYQELTSACGTGPINNCVFLFENISSYDSGIGDYGYWLENPPEDIYGYVWALNGTIGPNQYVINDDFINGVRPVITVNIEALEQ